MAEEYAGEEERMTGLVAGELRWNIHNCANRMESNVIKVCRQANQGQTSGTNSAYDFEEARCPIWAMNIEYLWESSAMI